jgi:hypothetical protein
MKVENEINMREIFVKDTPLKDLAKELNGLEPIKLFTRHRGCPKSLYNNKIVFHNIKGVVPHNNFVDYLKIAYNTDYGIVIKPDFIWYTILSELSYMVNANPEEVRKYFTYEKTGKINITGDNGSLIEMPIDQFVNLVLENVPMDLQKQDIIPPFSTSDVDSRFAFSATFLDMVHNYYTYDWIGCDYNKIKILGNKSDYKLMLDVLDKFNRIKPLQGYISQAKGVVQSIIDNWKISNFWRNILWTKSGYGGDRVDGWIKDLFNKRAYWNPHLSQVEATELTTKKTYVTVTGLLSSRLEDGYMIPNFERIICEKDVPDTDERVEWSSIDWDTFSKYDSFLSMSIYESDNRMNARIDEPPKPNPNLNKDYSLEKSKKSKKSNFDKKYKFVETKSDPKNNKKLSKKK